MVKGYLSKYLALSEYVCPCCGKLPVDFDLVNTPEPFNILFETFDMIREEYGYPLPAHGYRCLKHNAEVTDSLISVHPFGLALDIKGKVNQLVQIVKEKCPDVRLGIYPKHIHIDVGYLIFPRATEYWHRGARWQGTYK